MVRRTATKDENVGGPGLRIVGLTERQEETGEAALTVATDAARLTSPTSGSLGAYIEPVGPPPGVLNCHQSKYRHQQQLQASRRRNIVVIIPKQILRYRS